MKTKGLSSLLWLAIATKGLSQEATPVDCQLLSIVQIDGQAEEWPLKWIENPEEKFSYNVCSDNVNLYVRVKVKDESVRRKIALFGFTVWMDPKGKKKKNLGLRFPTGAEAQEQVEKWKAAGIEQKEMSSGQRADFQKEMNRSLITNLEMIELWGLADKPLTSTRSGITNGIKVAIASDEEGTYTYEAIIPFKSYRLSKSSLTNLGIGFETGKYTMPKGSNTPQQGIPQGTQTQSNNMGGTGSYGAGGRGMNRVQGYQRYGGNNEMANSTSMWVSVKLK